MLCNPRVNVDSTQLSSMNKIHFLTCNSKQAFVHSCYVLFCSDYISAFYIQGFVQRNSILIRSKKMQQYAGIYLPQNYSTRFGCPSRPSSGVHKTVTAASGKGHIMYQSNNLPPAWPIGHAGGRLLRWYVIWPVPEAEVTVWRTPDDGCNRHPKHVE